MKTARLLAVALMVLAGQSGGAGAQTLTTLFGLDGGIAGSEPQGGLLQGKDGYFYGTTSRGANYDGCDPGCGALFRISPSGVLTPLHWFTNSSADGSFPSGQLVQGTDGNIYGATGLGGTNVGCGGNCGFFFKMTPAGTMTQFASLPNFYVPSALVQGSDGNIYGAAASNFGLGPSSFFKISPLGTVTMLNSNSVGANWNLVQAGDGNIYGTTSGGGANSSGTVVQISTAGTVTTLYSFTGGADGGSPQAGLALGNDGYFYGTTTSGGSSSNGTVFKITSAGTLTTLTSFPSSFPVNGSLVQGSDGNFYGTTHEGCGTVFQVTPVGILTTVYSFDNATNGCTPISILQGIDGNFYGVVAVAPPTSSGAVFKLSVPLSPPPNQISGIQFSGTDVVTMASVAGETYQLQYRPSLTAGNWSNVPGSFVTNSLGGPLLLTNSPGALPPQAFYRVMISTSGGQTVPLLSADLAADGAYSGGWTNGCNGWTGLGPWTLTATSTNAGNDGFFLGSSTNNAFGSSPGIDTGGLAWGIYNGNFPARSWGMYANTGNTATAYRAFANGPVPVGGVFRVDMDTGFIDASSSVGFALCNGNASGSPAAYTNGARFIFEYIGQGAVNSYKVVDAGGLHNIGVGFTGAGLHLVFQLTATNTYTLLTIDNASGATNTFSGTLVGDPLQSVALFDNNAGSGPDHDTYFNSLQLTGP